MKITTCAALAVLLLVFAFSARAQEPDQLKLLTYNLHSETRVLDPMVDVIRAADADVVGMVEVMPQTWRHFEQVFSETYPYHVGEAGSGLLILSKYAIVDQQDYTPDGKRLLRAVIQISDRPFTVFEVYPYNPLSDAGYNADDRSALISFVLDQAAQATGPVIMMGDFNMEQWSDDYETLAADYVDSYRDLYPDKAGLTFPDYSTPQARVNLHFPSWSPLLLRLDYVFHDPAFTTRDAEVWPTSGGSDHRPLFVTLGLPAEAEPS